jgi:phage terminase Nu1 subunit (DNA packaging protein)/DNA-directed RNA polymerase subunit RPC12/RpoP
MANTVQLEKVCPGIFGISDRRYRQLAKEGIVPPVEDSRIDFIAAVKHLIAYYQKLVEGQGAITLTEERARLTKYMAEKARMELERISESVVDVAEVEKRWLAMGQACRSRLLSIPVKTAPLVIGRGLNEVKDLLDRAVCEALDELAADLSGNRIEFEDVKPKSAKQPASRAVKNKGMKVKARKNKVRRCVDCGKKVSKAAIRCRQCAGEINIKKRKEKDSGGNNKK